MKTHKFLSLFLSLCLLCSCLSLPATATELTTDDTTVAESSTDTESDTAESDDSGEDTDSEDTETSEESESSEESETSEETETSESESDSDSDSSDSDEYVITELAGGIDGLNDVSSIPTAEDATDSIEVEISGSAALLIDENTHTILYAENETTQVYPASTTKIMTALLVLEAIDRGELSLDTVVTITDEANADITSDSSTQDLTTGEEISVENLLYCLLVASANESANALAIAVSGSVSAFVDLMNERAEELGCTGTHFVNPHGLHDEDHYTTCIDLYLITEAAWQYETFRTIVGTDEYTVPATNLSDERHFYNTNLLLSEKKSAGYSYTYAVGVKTGTTSAAGSCLVAAAEYEGRLLFCIEMGCTSYTDDSGNVVRPVYTETAELFRHGFVDYYSLDMAEADELVSQVEVTLGKDTDYVLVSPATDVTIDLVKGLEADDFTRVYNLPDSVEAPISAGDVIGTMDLVYNDTVYATVDLVAVSDVELSVTEQASAMIQSFFQNPLVQVLLVVLLLLIVLLVVLLASSLTRRNRERYHGRRRTSRKNKNRKK